MLVLKTASISASVDDGSCGSWKGGYLNHVHFVLPFDKLTRDKQRGLDGTAFGEVGMDADKGTVDWNPEEKAHLSKGDFPQVHE